MKIKNGALLCTIGLASLAYAAKPWDATYTTFSGEYLIYSGQLGEEAAPTANDRKAALMLEGEAAKNLFGAIGPDIKDACGASSGLRIRDKGDLVCTYDKDDRRAPYTCHFGINLQTGKSIRGASC